MNKHKEDEKFISLFQSVVDIDQSIDCLLQSISCEAAALLRKLEKSEVGTDANNYQNFYLHPLLKSIHQLQQTVLKKMECCFRNIDLAAISHSDYCRELDEQIDRIEDDLHELKMLSFYLPMNNWERSDLRETLHHILLQYKQRKIIMDMIGRQVKNQPELAWVNDRLTPK